VTDATERTEITAEQAAETTARERGARAPGPAKVARAYFDAVAARDIDAMVACWAPGGIDNVVAIGPLSVPDGLRTFFTEVFAALPDSTMEVLDVVAARNQAAVRWRMKGTFCGGPFQGIEPTGARIELEGFDLLTIEDGLVRRNEAYYDGTQFARQIGLLPPRDSTAERGMAAAFNARTRFARSLFKPKVTRVADDVWLVAGGFPSRVMNVYLIKDRDGVIVFDAGIEAMTKAISSAAAGIGRVERIVLGHGHADHRGAAPGLGAPVFCHPDEVADAESDGGEHYFDYSKLEHLFARFAMPRFIKRWDGGPVKIAGTVSEGDEVAGFQVVHLPGHAPGLIGLWRESDRLALVSDTLYTLDPQTGRKGRPRVPHRAFNKDTEQARASIRKLAAMEPAAVWPGHADPVTGDVRTELERAATET
jgi:glyoxylase-like metal-dependent hydrolase (beta-lactamase superfamily II)/predicted ester cyclase